MPHREDSAEPEFKLIQVKPLHPTVGAEITGVDISGPVPDDVFKEIMAAITQWGVLVFRHAGLDDHRHVAFAAQFGELDDVKPYLTLGRKNRFQYDELFDVSNQEDDGSLVQPGTRRWSLNKGNSLFHVDSSFNPRRAGFSLLRAHELPPRGLGGNTDFADTRTAFAELPPALKKELEDTDYIAQHNIWHSRKKASPEFFKDVKPDNFPSGRHRLIQRHERSGRMNLYVANHIHKIEGLEPERSQELIEKLLAHATQDKYVISVEWEGNGDLIIWDNTAVMHRAHGGEYEGKFKRDMRRATVHDDSVHAWGLNEKSEKRMGLP